MKTVQRYWSAAHAQKPKTRDQMIAAARELISAGDTPRVERSPRRRDLRNTLPHFRHAELRAAANLETAGASVLPTPRLQPWGTRGRRAGLSSVS